MQLGLDAVDAMERGIEGDDFTEAVCRRNRMGEQLYDTLYAIGKDQILLVLANTPGMSEQFTANRAQVETRSDAFIAYGTPEVEDASGEPALGRVMPHGFPIDRHPVDSGQFHDER